MASGVESYDWSMVSGCFYDWWPVEKRVTEEQAQILLKRGGMVLRCTCPRCRDRASNRRRDPERGVDESKP